MVQRAFSSKRTFLLLDVGFVLLPVLLCLGLLFQELQQLLTVEGASWLLVRLVAASLGRRQQGVLPNTAVFAQ